MLTQLLVTEQRTNTQKVIEDKYKMYRCTKEGEDGLWILPPAPPPSRAPARTHTHKQL